GARPGRHAVHRALRVAHRHQAPVPLRAADHLCPNGREGGRMNLIVGISDIQVSKDRDTTISTYSLGSCIGVAAYDPQVSVGGMLHFQLPTGTMDEERARAKPAMFADSGLSALLERMAELGASERRLQITLAGAAQMLNDAGTFNIGRRNHA